MTWDSTAMTGGKRAPEYLATHDPLTGLFNARGVLDELAREVAVVRRFGTGGALLLLELDFDRGGTAGEPDRRPAGEALIRRVAKMVASCARERDVVGRVGEERFAVVLPHTRVERAMMVAACALERIRELRPPATGTPARASVGVALFERGVDAEEVLAQAEAALRESKDTGRDPVFTHAS